MMKNKQQPLNQGPSISQQPALILRSRQMHQTLLGGESLKGCVLCSVLSFRLPAITQPRAPAARSSWASLATLLGNMQISPVRLKAGTVVQEGNGSPVDIRDETLIPQFQIFVGKDAESPSKMAFFPLSVERKRGRALKDKAGASLHAIFSQLHARLYCLERNFPLPAQFFPSQLTRNLSAQSPSCPWYCQISPKFDAGLFYLIQ